MTASAARPSAQLSTDLARAVALGAGRLPETHHAALRELRDRVNERLALGDGLTVVALAGGTGVGKSALLNAVVGTEVATEGVCRPTTDHAVAVTGVMDGPTAALLDWLSIEDRRVVAGELAGGLVLVDLPDHDSIVGDHHVTSERLAGRVDALVVVVDPVKYARADLHEGPLARLRHHAEVLLVVLNRTDELSGDEVAAVRDDLADRLAAGGLDDVGVLVTSAVTGEGVATLRTHLEELASSRRAVLHRLHADAVVLATTARGSLPELPTAPVATTTVVDAVLEAADGHRAVLAHTVAWRHAAHRAVRSPLARLARAPAGAARRAVRELGLSGVARTGRPDHAVGRSEEAIGRVLARELALADRTGLAHEALDHVVREAAASAAPHAVAAVRDTAGRPPPRRWWWPVLAGLRGVAEAVALVGLVWSVLIGTADWLGLPALPTPQLTAELTWPAALLLGGVATRVLLGMLARLLVRRGSRRVARAAQHDLRQRLTGVAEDRLLTPYGQHVDAYRELHTVLGRLATPQPPVHRG